MKSSYTNGKAWKIAKPLFPKQHPGRYARNGFLWDDKGTSELSLAAGAELRAAEVATAREASVWISSKSCIAQSPEGDCEGYVHRQSIVIPEQVLLHCPFDASGLRGWAENGKLLSQGSPTSVTGETLSMELTQLLPPTDACTLHPCNTWLWPSFCPQIPWNKQKCFANLHAICPQHVREKTSRGGVLVAGGEHSM